MTGEYERVRKKSNQNRQRREREQWVLCCTKFSFLHAFSFYIRWFSQFNKLIYAAKEKSKLELYGDVLNLEFVSAFQRNYRKSENRIHFDVFE